MNLTSARFFWLLTLVPAACLSPARSSWALQFSPRLESAEWLVQGSQFECRISQPIPEFGEAVFQHSAGEKLHFQLLASTPQMKAGRAALTVTTPVWKPGGRIQQLGYVDVVEEKGAINVDEKMASRLLQELYDGKQVEFARRAWYDDNKVVKVGLSNINFRGAYDKYVGCLAELLPVNYGQIERTSLQFKAGQEELTTGETELLDDIITYSKADTQVRSLFIDGHSDSEGPRAENLEISKRRAEKVMHYLINGGLDPSAIVTRWHGERYPVASNRTADGRAQNRRVTVRLSKEPPPEIPEFDSNEEPETLDTQAILDSLGPPAATDTQ
ncbi:flagellar protein MotY [Halioxenophilus sp. WMMB6]|uniref:flagellar protein MotY n=1 Tax=Halioxenophilus sp. WMMB6 TaxID=3073815 RepID=UPI00295E95B7|nr:OmpA family protein [Halioxenophilus sp. WMMB6]